MKKLFLIISIFTFLFGNSQIAPNIWENLPEYIKGNLPLYFSEDYISVPDNAYYLQPDVTGNFTKAMVETAISNGENYIVFDADTLTVHYEESPHVVNQKPSYLYLNGIRGTALNPIILDFSNVYIDCYPNAINKLLGHTVFNFVDCENVILKIGKAEGDKFKRLLDTNEETELENTSLVVPNAGTRSLTVEGGEAAGFMEDVLTSIPYGSQSIDNSPLDNSYYLQPDGRYESIFYNVNPSLYSTFGLTGGLGYNRLLYYDMEDVTFKFYDSSDTFISQITGGQYYATYSFPVGTAKMKVNVKPMDGRNEDPTNFGHLLEYHPNNGTTIKNMKISDNHRGGVANIGANSTIENVEFFNTARYFSVPEFGINGITNSTTYHINCEDVVSRNLKIKNSSFADKFNNILLTHNINADITGNVFTGLGNNIFIYDLIYGSISGNTFNGEVSGGNGTNKNQIEVSNNTGNVVAILTNAAEWTNNNFLNAKVSGKGKMNTTTFTDSDYSYLGWTKEIHDNTFIGTSTTPYVNPESYIYKNTFKNTYLRFQHGDETDVAILDSVLLDNVDIPSIVGLEREFSNITIIGKNGIFKNAKIKHKSTNRPIDFIEGSWYFQNLTFQDINNYFIDLSINTVNTIPAKFYFKDCTFVGTGLFLNLDYGTEGYEITFDNCTIDPRITMPASYTNATVTMPTIVEPRTQPIPTITRNGDRTEIDVIFHIFTLKIRNKTTNEIVLDEDVCSTYLHYNADPTNFEYSIDGGRYWDSINN